METKSFSECRNALAVLVTVPPSHLQLILLLLIIASVDEIAERHRNHGLFVAFAPLEAPTIAVAVIVENGGGSTAASPIAREVIDAWLLRGTLADG